jgi:UDP-sugar transporter A1/2/3
MRYTRSIPGESAFSPQTAVIVQEGLKGMACVLILLFTEGSLRSTWDKPVEALKTAVPALLYLGQNNLQYLAVGLLDAATYTVTYQTKTIWSGIFSVLLMGKVLSMKAWCGLAMLSAGVGIVQLAGTAQISSEVLDAAAVSQRAQGFMIILTAAALSSMAGVRGYLCHN